MDSISYKTIYIRKRTNHLEKYFGSSVKIISHGFVYFIQVGDCEFDIRRDIIKDISFCKNFIEYFWINDERPSFKRKVTERDEQIIVNTMKYYGITTEPKEALFLSDYFTEYFQKKTLCYPKGSTYQIDVQNEHSINITPYYLTVDGNVIRWTDSRPTLILSEKKQDALIIANELARNKIGIKPIEPDDNPLNTAVLEDSTFIM